MEKNKIRTYFLYAIGEIMLVVIGILIALQVNNWNEGRKETDITESILYNLEVDINEDLESLESLNEMLASRKSDAEYILSVLQDENMEVDTNEMVIALTRVGWILNYTPTFATYNEIMNSGRLSLIKSDELKKLLADYKSQIADNRRIEEAYESRLKEAELLALSYMSGVPEANNLFTGSPENLEDIQIDITGMRMDQRFINLLKHISYHTATEILYKENLIIYRAEAIKQLLETEIKN